LTESTVKDTPCASDLGILPQKSIVNTKIPLAHFFLIRKKQLFDNSGIIRMGFWLKMIVKRFFIKIFDSY